MPTAAARGDVATILSLCSDTTEWEMMGPQQLAFAGTFKGPAEIGQWFGHVGALDDVREFVPQKFFESASHCTVLGFERTADRGTGVEFSTGWIHVFETRNGKITRWTGAFDSDARARAARA